MAQLYSGFIYDDNGLGIQSANVNLYDRNTTSPSRADATTNGAGYWSIPYATEGRFDVKLTPADGTAWTRWLKYDDAVTMEEGEFGVLRIRGTDDAFALIIQHTASAQRTVVYPDQNTYHPVVKIKGSDETVSNTASLQNDDTLLFAVGANEEWLVDLHIIFNSAVTPDFKCAWSLPSGTVADGHMEAASVGGSEAHQRVIDSAANTVTGHSADEYFHLWSIIRVSSTAGNVVFQWAQNTATVANTTVVTGSNLIARRLS
jgi:hypothetical protein